MKRFLLMLCAFVIALGLVACQSGGPSAEDFGLAGTWVTEFEPKQENGGTLQAKGEITFSGNTYKYSWFKKLIAEDGSIVYNWSETARETGSVSVSSDYMEWTANSYGTAEYNKGTQAWSSVNMKSTTNDYAIYYSIEGDKLTLKEDYNLDGDFDDVIGGLPETAVYTKEK